MFCEHNAKAKKEGCCAKCAELKPYKQFKTCKAQCFNCKECGWFYGPGAEEGKAGKPVPEPPKSAPTDFNGVIYPKQTTQQVKRYTADRVRAELAPKYDVYLSRLYVGQPPNWNCGQSTKDNFCISQWLMDELILLKAPDEERRDSLNFFNRKARSSDDLYQVAALAMNNYLDHTIEHFKGTRR